MDSHRRTHLRVWGMSAGIFITVCSSDRFHLERLVRSAPPHPYASRAQSGEMKNPVRVTVNQQRQHHPWMILCLAMAPPIDLESANINPLNGGRDEMNKVVIANPIVKIGWQNYTCLRS